MKDFKVALQLYTVRGDLSLDFEGTLKKVKEMGLKKTHVERLFFDDEMQEKGYNNKAVPSEIGYLLEQIHNRSFISEEISQKLSKFS